MRLIVAHAEHGMRPDSAADARFAQALAEHYGLPFELGELRLGEEASEEQARAARHAFLREVSRTYNRAPIATAHHQGDVLETAIINILRGTGRQGLSSLKSTDRYHRPLLDWDRAMIYQYALRHRLEWVEDETNITDRFLRNRVRHHLIPQLQSQNNEQPLSDIVTWFTTHNPEIDTLLAVLLRGLSEQTADHLALDRQAFSQLPGRVQTELVHFLLRRLRVRVLDKRLIGKVSTFITSSLPAKQFRQAPPLMIRQTRRWTLFQ